ncbi:hypothetical protein AAKU55_001779 [Oxalobacteraceae bacterium GrIS 1.11]
MSRPRWPRLSLGWSITLALIVKAALLSWLWLAFFATPQTKKMRLPTDAVERHFLAAAPLATLAPKANHESH